MLEIMVIMLGIGIIGCGVIALDVWSHKGCDGTRCAVCQDVNA